MGKIILKTMLLFCFFTSVLKAEYRSFKFDRNFITKKGRVSEKVFMTTSLMRVDSENYSYLIDLEDEILYYVTKGGKTSKIPLSDLKNQAQKLIETKKTKLLAPHLKIENRYDYYKGLKTAKGTIVLSNKQFITIRILKESRLSFIAIKFYKSLFEKLKFIPFAFTPKGIALRSSFNEISLKISEAFSYEKVPISSFLIFIFKPSSASQIEISNIVPQSMTKEDFFEKIPSKKFKSKGFFQRIFKFIKALYNTVLDIFSPSNKDKKNENVETNRWKIVKKGEARDEEKYFKNKTDFKVDINTMKGKSGFEFIKLWGEKSCGFYSSEKHGAIYLTGRREGFTFSEDEIKSLSDVFKEVTNLIAVVDRTKYSNLSNNIDKYLYDKFKDLFFLENAKKVKLGSVARRKHSGLCYLKARLYKQYIYIKTNF